MKVREILEFLLNQHRESDVVLRVCEGETSRALGIREVRAYPVVGCVEVISERIPAPKLHYSSVDTLFEAMKLISKTRVVEIKIKTEQGTVEFCVEDPDVEMSLSSDMPKHLAQGNGLYPNTEHKVHRTLNLKLDWTK
jgi:hypothetical protein